MTLYGKKKALERLSAFRREERFPHALLFTGERGTGKMTLADYTAMLLLCEKNGEKPCFSCSSCIHAESHGHPDIVYVKPILDAAKAKPGASMTEAVRNMVKNGYLKPNDGEIRIYIFEDAETMTTECQNALLKFIEEPLSFNRFIFTSAAETTILPTIRSRTVKVAVDPATAEECEAALLEAGIKNDEAKALSKRFSGNIGRCIQALENGDFIAELDIAVAIVAAVARKNEFEAAAAVSKLTTREIYTSVLFMLPEMLCGALADTGEEKIDGTEAELSRKLASVFTKRELFRIAEIVEKYITLSEFNPNINTAANALIAEIFDVI